MTKKLSTPFANDNTSLRNDVPVSATSDQTSQGIIGYSNGWTSISKLPLESGGQPPHMEDFNGVLYDVTSNIVDLNKGIPQYFDENYSSLIGGYPQGARICLSDNTYYVVSTIANNINDPNTNMSGWEKLSPISPSIADLRLREPFNIKFIETTSYYSGGNIGGSKYYFDSADTTTADDGLFTIVTAKGARWKLLLTDNKINVYQAGLKLQGADETAQFNSLMSVMNAYGLANGKRIELSALDGELLVSNTVTVDVNYVTLTDITIYVDSSLNPSSMMAILKLDGSVEEITTSPTLFKNTVIRGPEWRTTKLVSGILTLPSKNLNLLRSQDIRILDCNYGLVLGSNTYLTSFHNLVISRCGTDLADSVTAGLETVATNAGENISFHSGVMGESNSFAKINSYNNGAYFSFNNVSFDYSGGKDDQSFVQFDLNRGQYDFNDCHQESGNSSDRVKANYFNIGDYTNVNLNGGWVILNAVNSIPYFFYCTGSAGDRTTNPRINVRDTWVYAPGIKWWSNFGLDYFKPNIAVTDYTTSGKWQELNTMMVNGSMSSSGLLDAYYANYNADYQAAGITQTDAQNNSLLAVTWNDSAKAVQMSRLQQTSSDALNGGLFYLLVPRQPSRYIPHIEISYKTDVSTDLSSGAIFITATPVKWSSQYNKYGIPTNMGSVDTIGSARIGELTTDGGKVSIVDYAAQRMDYKNANYILLTVNMSSLINKVNFQITDIKMSQAD